jgi:outer membrane protein
MKDIMNNCLYYLVILLMLFGPFFYKNACAEDNDIDEEKLPITLADALELAIQLNPLIEEARLEWMISKSNVKAEWGQFEPEIIGYYNLNDVNRRNSAKEVIEQLGNQEYREDSEEYAFGIEGKMLNGAKYHFGYTMNKKKSTFTTDHEFNSYIGITLEQPLLKGATHGAPRAGINVANRERIIAFHKYRKKLMEIITQVESAYWNLAFAQELYQINSDSVEIAKKLVRDAEERVKTGKMSQLDLVEAEAGLALREISLSDSKQNIMSTMTELKLLITDLKLDSDLLLIAIDPLDSIDEPAPQEKDGVLKTIVTLHPDYVIRQMERERESIVLNYYKDQCLPQLNIIGSYNLAGIGTSLEDSLKMMYDQTNPTWSLKVELRVPLFTGMLQHNKLEAAKLKKEISEKNLKATEYEVINAITLLFQHIENLSKRIGNMKKVVGVKERLLEVEFSRLEAGYSNSRLVYEAEEELFDARQKELESIVQYKIALSRLSMVCGRSLMDKKLEKRENDQFFLHEKLLTNSIY